MASFLSLWAQMKRLNWANRITLLRIGAALPIIVLMHFPRPLWCWIAAFLFVLASLSDFLDGYIARREGMVTTFGKFLDPLADKLLICSVLVQMAALGWVPAWVTILVIVRELAVTGLRAVAADHGVVIAADRYGKWKTVLQIVALVPLLIHYPFWGLPVHGIGIFILYIALILTIVSGVNYFYRFYCDWSSSRLDTAEAADVVNASKTPQHPHQDAS